MFDRTAPASAQCRGGQRDAADPAGQRRRAIGERVDERRRRRLESADALSPIAAHRKVRISAIRCRRRPTRSSRWQRHRPQPGIISTLGEQERGPASRPAARAVITPSTPFPGSITAAGPSRNSIRASVQRDDRRRQQRRRRGQRPPGRADGAAPAKSTFRRHGDSGCRSSPRAASTSARACCSARGFNLFNHGNILGRAQTIYGDTAMPGARSASRRWTATNALPALANIDPPRTFQLQARFTF